MTVATDWLEAGREAFSLGKPRQAVKALARAIEAGADRQAVRQMQIRGLEILASSARIGWIHEAIAALDELTRLTGHAPEVHLAAAQLYESLGETALAIGHARHATSFDAWLIRARAGDRDALVVAESLAPRERLHDVAQAALNLGDFDAAERVFIAIDDDEARGWRGELALWRGDLDDALSLASGALTSARAHSVIGGVHVMREQYDDALPQLERALTIDREDSTARHWRAEALRKMGKLDAAIEEVDLAIAHSQRYMVTGQATRLLCAMKGHLNVSADTCTELVEALAPLAGPIPAAARAGWCDAVGDFIQRAFSALRGNRSNLPTHVIDGRLVAIPVRLNSRAAARRHQESIRSRPVSEVLAGFDALIADYGDLPTIHCHRGELQLWLGAWSDAERSFARALQIDRTTRWAWIGLGASQIGAGKFDQAAKAYDDALIAAPPPGRTMYVYRGELAFSRGDYDAAQRDLERALYMNPERIAAMLLLARVHFAKGDSESCRVHVARAVAAAPVFFRDLHGSPDEVATSALQMMRGNRSSNFVTYFTADGRMRFVPPPPIEAVRLK